MHVRRPVERSVPPWPLLLPALPLLLVGDDRRRPPASAAPAPITIAYITDLTGEGGSQNSTSPAGFNARIALQNAEGGVNGHKLVGARDRRPDRTHREIATAVQERRSPRPSASSRRAR